MSSKIQKKIPFSTEQLRQCKLMGNPLANKELTINLTCLVELHLCLLKLLWIAAYCMMGLFLYAFSLWHCWVFRTLALWAWLSLRLVNTSCCQSPLELSCKCHKHDGIMAKFRCLYLSTGIKSSRVNCKEWLTLLLKDGARFAPDLSDCLCKISKSYIKTIQNFLRIAYRHDFELMTCSEFCYRWDSVNL